MKRIILLGLCLFSLWVNAEERKAKEKPVDEPFVSEPAFEAGIALGFPQLIYPFIGGWKIGGSPLLIRFGTALVTGELDVGLVLDGEGSVHQYLSTGYGWWLSPEVSFDYVALKYGLVYRYLFLEAGLIMTLQHQDKRTSPNKNNFFPAVLAGVKLPKAGPDRGPVKPEDDWYLQAGFSAGYPDSVAGHFGVWRAFGLPVLARISVGIIGMGEALLGAILSSTDRGAYVAAVTGEATNKVSYRGLKVGSYLYSWLFVEGGVGYSDTPTKKVVPLATVGVSLRI